MSHHEDDEFSPDDRQRPEEHDDDQQEKEADRPANPWPGYIAAAVMGLLICGLALRIFFFSAEKPAAAESSATPAPLGEIHEAVETFQALDHQGKDQPDKNQAAPSRDEAPPAAAAE